MNQKYLLFIDWLELSLKGKLCYNRQDSAGNYIYGGFTFVLLENKRTPMFQEVYNIFLGAELVANMCANPHRGILEPDFLKLKFENKLLYELNWQSVIEQFFMATGFVFHNITRLDIACDFQTFAEDLKPAQFIKQFLDHEITKEVTGRPCKYHIVGEGKNLQTLRWGSKKSDRHAVLYNKSLELKESNKMYISKIHEEFFEAIHDVWRLEIRMGSKEVKKLLDVESGELIVSSLLTFLTPEVIASVYKFQLEHFLRLHFETGQHIVLIEFDKMSYLALQRYTTRTPNKVYKVKMAIKTLLEEYYLTGQISYLKKAFDYIFSYDLYNHLKARLKNWTSEFNPLKKLGYNYFNLQIFLNLPMKKARQFDYERELNGKEKNSLFWLLNGTADFASV